MPCSLREKNMLKTLKKQSRTKILFKIKMRDFLKEQLWVHIVVLGSVALCCWLFNRWVQGVQFCIAHYFIRKAFDKQFHFGLKKVALCVCLTLLIAWFSIPSTLPLTISLLSGIPIAFMICIVGYIVQDRIDLVVAIKKMDKYIDELLGGISHKDIYSMTDDELYEHCRTCGLSEEDCRIAHFVVIDRLKGKELYDAIGYSKRQTIRKRQSILKTIN